MEIEKWNGMNTISVYKDNLSTITLKENKQEENSKAFINLFKKEMLNLNAKLQKAGEASQKLATGETTDLISVTYDIMQAELAMKLTVQIRNKLLQAYQTFQHMQV